MENRSDTIVSYRDTVRVNIDYSFAYIDCIYLMHDAWAKRCNENYYTYVIELSLLWWKEPNPVADPGFPKRGVASIDQYYDVTIIIVTKMKSCQLVNTYCKPHINTAYTRGHLNLIEIGDTM